MREMDSGRRPFILKTCAGLAAALVPTVIGSADAAAQEHHHGMMMGQSSADGYTMPASAKGCGTCEFWGGPRRVSKDGKTITFIGLGWCNNAKSDNYQKMTGPEHFMGTWRKWSVLG